MKKKLKLKNIKVHVNARGIECWMCDFLNRDYEKNKATCSLFNHCSLKISEEDLSVQRCLKCLECSNLEEIFI